MLAAKPVASGSTTGVMTIGIFFASAACLAMATAGVAVATITSTLGLRRLARAFHAAAREGHQQLEVTALDIAVGLQAFPTFLRSCVKAPIGIAAADAASDRRRLSRTVSTYAGRR